MQARMWTVIVLVVCVLFGTITAVGASPPPEPDDSVCPEGWIEGSVGLVEICYPVVERPVAKDEPPPPPTTLPRYRTPGQDGGSGHHFQHQHHGTEGPSRRTTKISWQSVVEAGTKSTFKSVWNAWVNSGGCHDSYPDGAEGLAVTNCITFT